jgi:AraC-like DNA-binding protein
MLRPVPNTLAGDLVAERCLDARTVHAGGAVEIIHWRCLRESEASTRERVHTHHVLTFGIEGASCLEVGRRRIDVDPVTIAFHRPGSTYRTFHPWGCHDSGINIAFRADVAEEVLAQTDPRGDGPLLLLSVKPMRLALEPMIAALRHREGRGIDPLETDERALELLRAVLAPSARRAQARREGTRADHAALADDAREYLRAHFREAVRLDDVARAIGTSPFHLCRVFRAHTGLAMRGYLHRLRLWEAARALGGSDAPLSRIALDAGFASHSHLTARFTREVGFAPATLRRRVQEPHSRCGSAHGRRVHRP